MPDLGKGKEPSDPSSPLRARESRRTTTQGSLRQGRPLGEPGGISGRSSNAFSQGTPKSDARSSGINTTRDSKGFNPAAKWYTDNSSPSGIGFYRGRTHAKVACHVPIDRTKEQHPFLPLGGHHRKRRLADLRVSGRSSTFCFDREICSLITIPIFDSPTSIRAQQKAIPGIGSRRRFR